jgi:hypothetical protein
MNDTPGEATRKHHHFYHDIQRDRSLSTTIVSALAEVKQVDATSLGFALHDYVDTDALDTIFAPKLDGTTRGDCRLEFALDNYHVTVHSNGHIIIRDSSEPTPL